MGAGIYIFLFILIANYLFYFLKFYFILVRNALILAIRINKKRLSRLFLFNMKDPENYFWKN